MAEKTAQELENAANMAKIFAEAMVTASRESNTKVEADKAARQKQDEATKRVEEFGKQLGGAALTYTKTMLTGGEGLGKFSGSITAASDAAGNMATTMLAGFGPLGLIVGGLIKVFGQLAGASLKQNDAMLKSYRDLSEIGSVSGSLEKLKDDLGKVGLTSEEAQKFGDMMKKVAPELASFGGSVTAGKDKLIGVVQGMIGPNNEIERAMARIGYGAEEMRDATADYIAKQSRLGLAQNKTNEELRQESSKYMVTLRELGELTGMSRDEAQKLMDQQQSEYRYGEYLRNLEMSGKTEEAANMRAYMASYEKTFGKDAANGLMELMVNKGAMVGEASVKAHLSTQGQAYEQALKAQKGQIDMYDGLKNTAAGMRKNMDQLGDTYNIAGQGVGALAGSNEQLVGMQKIEGQTREEIAKRLKDDMGKTGDRLDQNTKMEQQARALRISADRAMWEVGNATVSIFEKINTVVFSFGKGLATIIDTISAVIPGMKTTHLADSFRDKSDNERDMANVAKEKANLLAEQARLQKEIADSTTNNAELGKQIQEKQKAITAAEAEARKLKGDDRIAANAEIAKEKAQLRQMEQLAKEQGTGDQQKQLLVREERLQKLKEQLAAEDKRQQELEREAQTLGGATKSVAGAETATKVVAAGANSIANNAQGQQVGKEQLESRKNAAAGLSQSVAGRSDEALNKLNFKNRAENTGGGGVDPALIGLAEKISEAFPNSTFTAMNDKFHQDKREGSRHTQGKALDVALNPAPKTPEEAAAFREKMKDLGASKVLDEYFADKSAGTTGGHFHAEVARNGGIFNGPQEGYPVVLHGNEAVVPMPNLDNFVSDVKKESLDSVKDTSPPTATTTQQQVDTSGIELIADMLTSKFEDMISQLEAANDTLKNLLTYTKA